MRFFRDFQSWKNSIGHPFFFAPFCGFACQKGTSFVHPTLAFDHLFLDIMTTILVFEDNPDLRQVVVQLLNSQPDFRVVGEAANCRDILKLATKHQPGFVLLDIGMPDVNGLDGLHLLKSYFPEVKTMMFTSFDEDDKVTNAICLGADGYILKTELVDRLPAAIREIMNGGAPMTPSIARKVLTLFPKRSFFSFSKPPEYELTDREREVLNLLSKGHSRKMIADEMSVLQSTIDSHIKSIYQKMQVHSVGEAIRKGISDRLVSLGI